MFDKLLGSSWKTTLIGFAIAFLGYFTTAGVKFPETGTEWKEAVLAALVGAFGRLTADNKPDA